MIITENDVTKKYTDDDLTEKEAKNYWIIIILLSLKHQLNQSN